MSKIAIIADTVGCPFEGPQYEIDLDRKFGGHKEGDLLCHVCPFGCRQIPLELDIAVRTDGTLIFRGWKITANPNSYLHTNQKTAAALKARNWPASMAFVPTPAQLNTVSGLFSGRIKFEGLKLAVGGTVQDVCPVDVKKEEARTNKKIYLNWN